MGKPFENTGKKIPFEELVELIDTKCDYHFSIVVNEIDPEIADLLENNGVNPIGFKHVIETSGTNHGEKRHGKRSNDRNPIGISDYLLIPTIIRERDHVEVSPQKDKSHNNLALVYRKQIGDTYYYVEEIRKGNKSLAFVSLRKRKRKNPSR